MTTRPQIASLSSSPSTSFVHVLDNLSATSTPITTTPRKTDLTDKDLDWMQIAFEDLEKTFLRTPTIDEVLEKFYGFHYSRKVKHIADGKLADFKAEAKAELAEERWGKKCSG
ncbi:hypothetical protein E2P81_ATG05438 [Venturia nashicola]|uniref:Uncharacterized protein n=1 Tax=Venturia nashicola TaxID=86259 RepID=A0A4Z1P0R3_9PEZI|nr:hypothetical protein E6O75_ATG05573 [Venturia nashicola]TLD32462.1 hypothetical protein E2P81_ATG05438 [Venturia nashicola]